MPPISRLLLLLATLLAFSSHAFTSPLKAQPNLEVKLEGKTLDGKSFSSSSSVDVVANVKFTPIRLVEIDEDDELYWNMVLATGSIDESLLDEADRLNLPPEYPLFTEVGEEIYVIYEQGNRASLNGFEVPLFVTLENAQGQILPINTKPMAAQLQNTAYATSGAAPFVDGIAQIPITLKDVPADNNAIYINGFDFSTSGNQGVGLRPQQGGSCMALPLRGTFCSPLNFPQSSKPSSSLRPTIRVTVANSNSGAEAIRAWEQRLLNILPINTTPVVQPAGVLGSCMATAASTKPKAATNTTIDLHRSGDADCEGNVINPPKPIRTRSDKKTPYTRLPAKKDRDAASELGIITAWMEEGALICRGEAGTRRWTLEERQGLWKAGIEYEKILQEYGCRNAGYPGVPVGNPSKCTSAKRNEALEKMKTNLRKAGLYGQSVKLDKDGKIMINPKTGKPYMTLNRYASHHINSSQCFENDIDNPDNIAFTPWDKHESICHGGKYSKCAEGNLQDRQARFDSAVRNQQRCDSNPPTQ